MNHSRKVFARGAVLLTALFFTLQICKLQGQTNDTPELAHRELAVRYAKTKLDLAEADLQRAMEMSNSNVIPKLTVERVRSSLAIAKEQYSQALSRSPDGSRRVRLRHAEERMRLAELRLEAGKKLQTSGSINDVEMKRLRLNHELARLSLLLTQEPDDAATHMEYMQDQIDRFGEDILSLDERISKLESLQSRR